jgi:hypothetical protein
MLAETLLLRLLFGGAVSIAATMFVLVLMLPGLRREASTILAWRFSLSSAKKRML